MEKGRIYTTEFVSDDETLAWVDRESQSSEEHILLFSRLPHRRLLEHLDINAVEAYWLTERVTEGAIQPNMDEIYSRILEHLSHHRGIVILEGLEWLVTKNGEDAVLSFIRNLREAVHRTPWTIIIPIRILAFEPLWLARLRREAPSIELPSPNAEVDSTVYSESEAISELDVDVDLAAMDILDDGSPRLIMLTRLPSAGFTETLLRKRILQWRRMGLDVSEVEPALNLASDDAYALYSKVEEKVRRAVDLEQHLELHSEDFTASEEATARFRIRQLTGLDQLEEKFFGN
ncbi:MAG TPA: DUF835 domain-containing protein [Candidatus Poseidoniaceae archaeon]|jgi:hypothetical protein|nr:DUF835 domain-containing protein [Candidatus Poseidoniaceae archaeon]